MRYVTSVVFVISAIARDAHAQVNIESLRTDLKKTPAMASLEGAFNGRTGNVESLTVGGTALAAARTGRHGGFGTTQADYARFGGETRVSKTFIHLRYSYQLLDWLYPEAFVQQQQDKFQRLKLRELVGAGPRFILIDDNELRVAVGTAYMFEYERISVPSVPARAPDPAASTAQRSSTYVTSTWQPDARVRLSGTLYAQPRWDDAADFRALFEAALTTAIVNRLAVKVLVSIRYDSEPPTTVKTTDAEVRNALVLQF